MQDDEFFDDQQVKSLRPEPEWIRRTLWFAPRPAHATVAMAFAIFGALMCYFMGSAQPFPVVWAFGITFAGGAALIAAASISRHIHRRRRGASDSRGQTNSERLPTAAIIVGFISVYSLLMMIGLHVFRNFFAANRPGGLKYNVTLGIALASSMYMTIHGRSVIRKHFGARGGRNVTVSPGQALLIVALALSFGAYFAWIMG